MKYFLGFFFLIYVNGIVAQETYDSELFSEKEIINFYKGKLEYFYSELNNDSTNISSFPDSLRIYIIDDDINGLKSLNSWASDNGFNSTRNSVCPDPTFPII